MYFKYFTNYKKASFEYFVQYSHYKYIIYHFYFVNVFIESFDA